MIDFMVGDPISIHVDGKEYRVIVSGWTPITDPPWWKFDLHLIVEEEQAAG